MIASVTREDLAVATGSTLALNLPHRASAVLM